MVDTVEQIFTKSFYLKLLNNVAFLNNVQKYPSSVLLLRICDCESAKLSASGYRSKPLSMLYTFHVQASLYALRNCC